MDLPEEPVYQDISKRVGLGRKRAQTLSRIRDAAMDEFEEKGFSGASLRNIAKAAGVTTGAFYSYFDSKEELFASLTAPHYQWLLGRYDRAQEEFAALPDEEKPSRMGELSSRCMEEMLDYAFEHPREVRLLLTGAEGTVFGQMVDRMVDAELLSTCEYLDVLKRLGLGEPKIDMYLAHLVITGNFRAFFEIIIHQKRRDEAEMYLRQLQEFYTAGWMRIMKQGEGSRRDV